MYRTESILSTICIFQNWLCKTCGKKKLTSTNTAETMVSLRATAGDKLHFVSIYHRNLCGAGSAVKPEAVHSGHLSFHTELVGKSRNHKLCSQKGLRLCVERVMQCPVSHFTRELNFQENVTQFVTDQCKDDIINVCGCNQ